MVQYFCSFSYFWLLTTKENLEKWFGYRGLCPVPMQKDQLNSLYSFVLVQKRSDFAWIEPLQIILCGLSRRGDNTCIIDIFSQLIYFTKTEFNLLAIASICCSTMIRKLNIIEDVEVYRNAENATLASNVHKLRSDKFPITTTREIELGQLEHTQASILSPPHQAVSESLRHTRTPFIKSFLLLHGPKMKTIINHPFRTCQAQLLTLSFSEQKDFALNAFQLHISSALIHCGNKPVLLRLMFLRLRFSASVQNVSGAHRALLVIRSSCKWKD